MTKEDMTMIHNLMTVNSLQLLADGFNINFDMPKVDLKKIPKEDIEVS